MLTRKQVISKYSAMKKIIILFSIILFACSDEQPIGSISFSSDIDCDIRIFDSAGRQIAHEKYKVENIPVVVTMNRTGIYVVRAVSEEKTVKNNFAYTGGDVPYFIIF